MQPMHASITPATWSSMPSPFPTVARRFSSPAQDSLPPQFSSVAPTQVLQAAGARHTPVIIVLCNGGIVSIDTLIPDANAIIEAFNPVDHGTHALAQSLFGRANRWGKLPVTGGASVPRLVPLDKRAHLGGLFAYRGRAFLKNENEFKSHPRPRNRPFPQNSVPRKLHRADGSSGRGSGQL